MDKDYLINGAAQVGATITSEQAEVLCAYYEKVVECNKAFNLTAITEEKDFAVKHIIDSLAGVSEIPHGAKLCDIGSGGGFPSMPIAIAREDVSVTALDSTAKKMAFVAQSAKELGIKRSEVVFALEAICDPVSLYEPVYSDSGENVCVMDQIGDDRNTDEHWLEQIALGEAVSKLSGREKRILAMRFSSGKTQMEVAREIGISQAQVSRLEKNAINRIKKEIQ